MPVPNLGGGNMISNWLAQAIERGLCPSTSAGIIERMISELAEDRLHDTESTWTTAWGVRDSHDRVTECPSAQDARDYQAAHGGKVVSR